MTVTEIKQAVGSWELRLREEKTPRAILDALTFFGHIALIPGKVDPAQYGDGLLAAARYVGVYRSKDATDGFTLKGSGMAFWLGDEDDKGDIHETPVTLTDATFAASINALLPPGGAVISGTINSVPGAYTGTHQWETPRKSITYVTDTFGAEWRVNGNATLDVGTVAQLYVTDPRALLIPKGFGSDLQRKAIVGRFSMGTDVEDTTTRVVLLAEGQGDTIVTSAADAAPTPYMDIHGNPIKVTRVVSESGTETANAEARAQLQLNRFLNPRRSVGLNSDDYDINGVFRVGDYLDVYNPESGFVDPGREVYWKGDRINPMALRCVEMTWPVPPGWTVAFRDINGRWIDLSQCYASESGQTTIVVGELARGISSVGGEPIGIRPQLPSVGPDATIPAAPTFGDFSTGSYQPQDGDWTKAAVLATWSVPPNTDGSTVTDGGHYEIRHRVNTFIGYGIRWGQLSTYRWGELSANRWGAPITDPIDSGEWHTVYVPWGQTQMLIQELTPGVEYEFQIRAVDSAIPAHQGPWSGSRFVIASGDLFAPSQPAAPIVASSLISIQIVHNLGRASGGTFNLEPDLAYLSVHVGGNNAFLPNDSNMVGKLIANSGMITGNIPAVGTFGIEQTDGVWIKVKAVDRSGNESPASDGAQATVLLIDDAHISNLTVSKVTAGTILAAWLLAGSIKTAESGARVEIAGTGIQAYRADGLKTVDIDSATGDVDIIGRFEARGDLGASVIIEPVIGGDDPQIRLLSANAIGNRGHISAFTSLGHDFIEMSSKDIATDSVDGGYTWLSDNGASIRHRRIGSVGDLASVALTDSGVSITSQPSGGVGASLSIGSSFTDVIYGRGKMAGSFQHSDASFAGGQNSVGAGFGSLIIMFPLTLNGYNINPVYAIYGSGGAVFTHSILSLTSSSWQVGWSNATDKVIWHWISRS